MALLGAGLATGVGFGASQMYRRQLESKERQAIIEGSRMNGNARFQMHDLRQAADGSRALVFRPILPADPWEQVLKSPVLAKEVRSAALQATLENPVISIPDQYRSALITELRNSLSVVNRSVPGAQKEFLLLLTCEDSNNTIPDFQTAIRGFLITPENLAYFADLQNVKNTYVDNPTFAFRLLALHYIAIGLRDGTLQEGVHFSRLSLPARDDDHPLSTSKPVDWTLIYNKYNQLVEESRDLSKLGGPELAPTDGTSLKTDLEN
jgi:hypothetical protein